MKLEIQTLTPAKIPLISQETQLRLLLETINDPDMQVIDCKNSKKKVVSRRGSQYRGVSKNGGKWQVRISDS